MPVDFKILRAPMIPGVGVPVAVCVTPQSLSPIVEVEWYLLVRSHQDAIGYRSRNNVRVDTTVNTDDLHNQLSLTPEFAEQEAMQQVQFSLACYRARLSKEPAQPQQFPDTDFAEKAQALEEMLWGGAGRKELESIMETTASGELRQHIFRLLNTIPKRPQTASPYSEPTADPDLRTS